VNCISNTNTASKLQANINQSYQSNLNSSQLPIQSSVSSLRLLGYQKGIDSVSSTTLHSLWLQTGNNFKNFLTTCSPCCMPIFFRPCCFNVPYQSTALLNLHSLLLGLAPFGWLCSTTLARIKKNEGVKQNWKAVCSLQTTSITVHLPFISYRVVYLHPSFFVLPTNSTMTYPK